MAGSAALPHSADLDLTRFPLPLSASYLLAAAGSSAASCFPGSGGRRRRGPGPGPGEGGAHREWWPRLVSLSPHGPCYYNFGLTNYVPNCNMCLVGWLPCYYNFAKNSFNHFVLQPILDPSDLLTCKLPPKEIPMPKSIIHIVYNSWWLIYDLLHLECRSIVSSWWGMQLLPSVSLIEWKN